MFNTKESININVDSPQKKNNDEARQTPFLVADRITTTVLNSND